MARWCGNVPCSMPVRNTYGYSRPFAVCRVIIVTLPESSFSPWQLVGIGHQRGGFPKIPPMWRLACSARIPPPLIAAGKDYRRGSVLRILGALQLFQNPTLGKHFGNHFGWLRVMVLRKSRKLMHHVSERTQRFRRARGHAFDLFHMFDRFGKKWCHGHQHTRQRVLPHERPVRASAH